MFVSRLLYNDPFAVTRNIAKRVKTFRKLFITHVDNISKHAISIFQSIGDNVRERSKKVGWSVKNHSLTLLSRSFVRLRTLNL